VTGVRTLTCERVTTRIVVGLSAKRDEARPNGDDVVGHDPGASKRMRSLARLSNADFWLWSELSLQEPKATARSVETMSDHPGPAGSERSSTANAE
jgi:hypothetical protein